MPAACIASVHILATSPVPFIQFDCATEYWLQSLVDLDGQRQNPMLCFAVSVAWRKPAPLSWLTQELIVSWVRLVGAKTVGLSEVFPCSVPSKVASEK